MFCEGHQFVFKQRALCLMRDAEMFRLWRAAQDGQTGWMLSLRIKAGDFLIASGMRLKPQVGSKPEFEPTGRLR